MWTNVESGITSGINYGISVSGSIERTCEIMEIGPSNVERLIVHCRLYTNS